VKPCVIIPCYNHAATVAAVARGALGHCPVIVVDDGSTLPLPELPGCVVVRLGRNQGKAEALRMGFRRATELGFTHAITMDADGQHFAEDLPQFLAAMTAQPGALVVGVRDFHAAGCPTHRRRSNAVSTFWYRVETGVRLGDTQCGFRGYPLALTQRLKIRSSRYAFELEMLVRAAWVGTAIVPLGVKCSYAPDQLRQSHFRPLRDLAHITLMNIGLVLQSWCVPLTLRRAWSQGEHAGFWRAVHEFFADHAESPGRLAAAVGVGLFFGIAPIWGYQLVAALAVAHFLSLNKVITALASNISIPPVMPFILYTALALGHWLFTGQWLDVSPGQMSRARALEYLWHWAVGSVALGMTVAVCGTAVTYVVARVCHRK
jgi:uncharacterized protein (DUF2062 family)